MNGTGPFALWRWTKLFNNFDGFLEGLVRTVSVSVLALILALVLGLISGILSTTKSPLLRGITRVYVEFYQNIPLVIQVFFMYNGLAMMGLRLSVFTIGVVGVGLYHGAYISEVVKTGIRSVDRGQTESAKSQGFTYTQTMIYIILPQAMRGILPPLTNQAVNLVKNTSVLAMISGFDLMYAADSWASTSLDYGPAYFVCAIIYFLLCFPLAKLAGNYENKLKRNEMTVGRSVQPTGAGGGEER